MEAFRPQTPSVSPWPLWRPGWPSRSAWCRAGLSDSRPERARPPQDLHGALDRTTKAGLRQPREPSRAQIGIVSVNQHAGGRPGTPNGLEPVADCDRRPLRAGCRTDGSRFAAVGRQVLSLLAGMSIVAVALAG